jgi:hypothetical protein
MHRRPSFNRWGPSSLQRPWYGQPARNTSYGSAGANLRFGEFVATSVVTSNAAYSKEKVKELACQVERE